MNKSRLRDERGFVLVSALLFIAIMSALVVRIMVDTLSVSRQAAAESQAARHVQVLDAALNRAIFALENPSDELLGKMRSTKGGVLWRFDGLKIRIDLQAESGKLDINTADPVLLRGVIALLFADDEAVAEAAIQRLSTWREAGRRFEFVEALLRPADRLRHPVVNVRRVFTVLTGQTGVDPAAASDMLLSALPGQSRSEVEALRAARAAGTTRRLTSSHVLQNIIVRELPIYTVGAEIAADGSFSRREAAISIDLNTQNASILSWKTIVKPVPKS
jgi:type II secretory pathway component PulK